jgi:hypothetical protein
MRQVEGGVRENETYIAGIVDQIIDAAVNVEGLLGGLLKIRKWGGHIEGESGGTGLLEVAESRWRARSGDDSIATAECLVGKGTAEARAAASDEPDFLRHGCS